MCALISNLNLLIENRFELAEASLAVEYEKGVVINGHSLLFGPSQESRGLNVLKQMLLCTHSRSNTPPGDKLGL